MLGWLKQLFGPAGAASAPGRVQGETIEYQGYRITPTPIAEGGQFRVSGVISLISDPERTHTFIRSDLVAGQDEACEFTLLKARLMIDQLGERLFDQ